MPGKYTPLEIFLRGSIPTEKSIKLTFEQIEKILNSKLPNSANEMSWWEHEIEGNHVNKRAWAFAGWKVGEVNLTEKWARFTKS